MLSKRSIIYGLRLERGTLIEQLSSLDLEQWEIESLAKGWNVRNVVSHLIAFELDFADTVALARGKRKIDDITHDQSMRYSKKSPNELIRLLVKGQRIIAFLFGVIPAFAWKWRVIPIGGGRAQVAEIASGTFYDRFIHRIDIAASLGLNLELEDPRRVIPAVEYIIQSLEGVGKKMDEKYYGKYALIKLSGVAEGEWYWEIGPNHGQVGKPSKEPAITVNGDSAQFVLYASGRKAIVSHIPKYFGDDGLISEFDKHLHIV